MNIPRSFSTSMVKFKIGQDLLDLLGKALEVEHGFESSSTWEGYKEIDNELMRDLLFTLSSESGEHARLVEDLMGCVLSGSGVSAPPLRSKVFNFERLEDQEIMRELLRYDELALDLYTRVRDGIQGGEAERLLKEECRESFIEAIDGLIKAERNHIAMINRFVGNIQRIR